MTMAEYKLITMETGNDEKEVDWAAQVLLSTIQNDPDGLGATITILPADDRIEAAFLTAGNGDMEITDLLAEWVFAKFEYGTGLPVNQYGPESWYLFHPADDKYRFPDTEDDAERRAVRIVQARTAEALRNLQLSAH